MWIEWRLRHVMAERNMWHATDLARALEQAGHHARGVSPAQISRLVAGTPERINLHTLASICDVLDCSPGDLLAVRHSAKATS